MKKALLCGLLMLVMWLTACSNNTTGTGAEVELVNEEPEYKYDIIAGRVVLRTGNYDDIVWASNIPESDRKECGYWHSKNTESEIVYNDVLFAVIGSIEESVVRYDAKGYKEVLLETDDYLKLIACEDDCLYFYRHNSDKKIEYYYCINKCTSAEYSIECIAEMPCPSSINHNLHSSIIKSGEWIYYLYCDDPGDHDFWYETRMWVYRLSINTGESEMVSSVFEKASTTSRKLTKIKEYDGKYIVEGVLNDNSTHRTRGFYLFDPEKESVELLCTSGCSDSNFKVVSGDFFHVHQNNDGTTGWARTSIQGGEQCEEILVMDNGDSDFEDISEFAIHGNNILYSTFAHTKASNYLSYYSSYYVDLDGNGTSLEFDAIEHKPITYIYNDTMYMFVNNAVAYSNLEHEGKWYDSGVRYARRSASLGLFVETVFFAPKNGKVYLVAIDWVALNEEIGEKRDGEVETIDLNKYCNSTLIKTDYKAEITSDSTVFWPNVATFAPSYLNGAAEIMNWEDEDIYGNRYGDLLETGKYISGLQFYPTDGYTGTARYDCNGKYKYISGVIGASSWSCATGQLKFYADGKLLYETPVLSKDSAPIEFMLDIGNAESVVIEGVSQDGFRDDYGIACVFICLDHVTFHDCELPPYNGLWKREIIED